MQHLGPHARPPEGIRTVYKKYQKMKLEDLDADQEIVDLAARARDTLPPKVCIVKELGPELLNEAFRAFAGSDASDDLQHQYNESSIAVYEHEDMPGNTISP